VTAEGYLVVMEAKLSQRLAARIRARSLDRELAAGARPQASVVLSLRAESLIRAETRERLAEEIRSAVRQADEPGCLSARIPVCRDAVARTAEDLRRLASRLQAPRPVSVEGVARARELLTDGRGPLYDRGEARRLGGAVRDAVAALDRAA
jgi:hypothetical protein